MGLKVLRKVEQIVREEQNRAGAVEVLMPTIQSADLWRESGRYGKEMLLITDRHERDMLFGPTNEEMIARQCGCADGSTFKIRRTGERSMPQRLDISTSLVAGGGTGQAGELDGSKSAGTLMRVDSLARDPCAKLSIVHLEITPSAALFFTGWAVDARIRTKLSFFCNILHIRVDDCWKEMESTIY